METGNETRRRSCGLWESGSALGLPGLLVTLLPGWPFGSVSGRGRAAGPDLGAGDEACGRGLSEGPGAGAGARSLEALPQGMGDSSSFMGLWPQTPAFPDWFHQRNPPLDTEPLSGEPSCPAEHGAAVRRPGVPDSVRAQPPWKAPLRRTGRGRWAWLPGWPDGLVMSAKGGWWQGTLCLSAPLAGRLRSALEPAR